MCKLVLLLITLLLVGFYSKMAFAFEPWFEARIDYDTGVTPMSVFSIDLDGDGDNDLVTANSESDNVSILINNGDRTFQTAINYGAGDGPRFVFSEDLDHDGDYDLAVANSYSNDISILLNNGNGTFQSAVNYDVGYYPTSIFAIELVGVGDIDLAVTKAWDSYNDVTILKNRGDGTFFIINDFATGECPTSVFSIDLDDDGDNDLAVVNGGIYPEFENGNISILLNNGSGNFREIVNYDAGDSPSSVFSIDLDDDGDNDLAVANRNSNNVSVLKNNGNGTFQAAINYDVGVFPYSIFSIDFNGDGDNDLVTANLNSHTISILLNNGDGTFQAAIYYDAGYYPTSVFSIDLDGDSDNDLITANFYSDNISILFNLSWPYYICGNANWDAFTNLADIVFLIEYYFNAGPEPVHFATGDFNCDGKIGLIDLVLFNSHLFHGATADCCL